MRIRRIGPRISRSTVGKFSICWMGSWKVSDDLWYGEADLLPTGVLKLIFPTTSSYVSVRARRLIHSPS